MRSKSKNHMPALILEMWSEVSLAEVHSISLTLCLSLHSDTSSNSFVISFGFQVYNVTMSKDAQLRNETHGQIQDCVNKLVRSLLLELLGNAGLSCGSPPVYGGQ